MEKLFLIRSPGCSGTGDDYTKKVNGYLEQGWRVKMISSAAAGAGEDRNAYSWAYVVLEKDGE